MGAPTRCAGAATVLVLLMAGCGGSSRAGAGADPHVVRARFFEDGGLAATVPAGWHATTRPLTRVDSPVQRVVVTSFPLHQTRPDPDCRPATALRQMPPHGAMLYVFEYLGLSRYDGATPPRPRHFRLDSRTRQHYECAGLSYMLRFHDHGRVFQAHVYLDRHPPRATLRKMLALLDSLRVLDGSGIDLSWRKPSELLARGPYMGVACHIANYFGCDRVGLSVWLRAPARAVTATIDGRPVRLDDPQWSGALRQGRRKLFAGFLQPAGMLHGPLRVSPGDGTKYWSGSPAVVARVVLRIEQSPGHVVHTRVHVMLAPGWG